MQAPPVIDIEASGFGRGSYPIEVGFVLGDGQTYCSLIRPDPAWRHWDAAAESIHGIQRETLDRYGKPLQQVALEMNRQLRGMKVYCDGWLQDYSWLGRLYDTAELVPSFELADLRSLLSEDEAALWHGTKVQVEAELQLQRHRASTDARVLQTTLLKVKEAVQ